MKKLNKHKYETGNVKKSWVEPVEIGFVTEYVHYLKLRDGKLVVAGWGSVCVYASGTSLEDVGELLSEVRVELL